MAGNKSWRYITVGGGKYKVKISTSDFAKVSQHTWRVIRKDSGRLKVVTDIKRGRVYRQVSLGHFLMKPPKGKMVYPRRFMEGLDYRRDNLIVCTLKERQRMLPKSRNMGTSRFRGVSYVRRIRKWQAGIKVNGKSINLGVFKSELEAARSYNTAARKYFGDVAYQNPLKPFSRRRRRN